MHTVIKHENDGTYKVLIFSSSKKKKISTATIRRTAGFLKFGKDKIFSLTNNVKVENGTILDRNATDSVF